MTNNKLNHNSIKNDTGSDARGKRPLVITVFTFIVLVLIFSIISFFYYSYMRKNLSDDNNTSVNKVYTQYYALICEDNDFNEQIFEYAKIKGDEMGICIDMLSKRMDHDHTIDELFEMAMESKVDGIIVEAKDGQKMKSIIDKACSNGIDVVTLLSDSPDSMRRSSIQVGAYNLGKTYGHQIVSKEFNGNEKIIVVTDSSNSDSNQNLIFVGIQDTINEELGQDNAVAMQSFYFDGSDTFIMEEMIRDMFIDETLMPDIIICPDDQATEVVYQALVDYNKVGQVRLIGYHDSNTVLSGIRQGVIEASIAVDVKELGEYAVEALSEYKATGFASEYYSVDSTLIDINNVSTLYLEKP